VLRYDFEPTNRYFVEVQDWVAHGLRGHGVDVNMPIWPGCLDQPRDHPASCLGRMCVSTFTCVENRTTEGLMRMAQAGDETSVVLFNLEIIMDDQLLECYADPRFGPLWRQAVV
jgi:hypothetical protein